MEIEATQAMDANCDSDEEDDMPRDKRMVAVLKVHKQKGYEEQDFPIYEGLNIVGRHEKSDIYIPAAPVSKKHACIEVVSGVHLIFDYGSKNKTKRGQLVLRPQVRYELTDGVKLAFADCECHYSWTHEQMQADDTDSMQKSAEERICATDELNASSQSTQRFNSQDRQSTGQVMKGRDAKIVNREARNKAGAGDEEIYAADSDGDSPIKRLLIAETPRGSNTITVVKQTPGTVLRRIHGAPFNDTGNSTKILNQSSELNASSDMSLRLDTTPISVTNSPVVTSRSVDGSATVSQQKCALTSDSVDNAKGLTNVDMGPEAVEPDLSDPKDFESDLTGQSAVGSDLTCQKVRKTSDEYSLPSNPKQKSEKEKGNIDVSIERQGKLSDSSILEAKLVVQESDGDATDNSEEAEYQLEIGKTGFFTPNLLENIMTTKIGFENNTGIDKTERNDSENFSQDCMLIATQAYGVQDSEEPQRASDFPLQNDVRMEEASVSPSELCIQESDEEEGEENGIMTSSLPKAGVSGKVLSSPIKDTEMNDTKGNLVSDEDYDTYDSEQEADTGPPVNSGPVVMTQPVPNSDQEASTVPLLLSDQETSTAPLPLSDQEASTVPLSCSDQEASTVPLPLTDQEASTVPYKEEADTVPLLCSDQEADTVPLSPSDQEANTVPSPCSDQEVNTVPLPCSDQEVNTVPLSLFDQVSKTIPLSLSDQEASTVPFSCSDQEANTVPLPCSDQEAGNVPQYDFDKDAIVSPSSSKKSSETLRSHVNEQESTASLSNSEKKTSTTTELAQQKDNLGTEKRVAKNRPKGKLKDDDDDDEVLERREIVGGREAKSLGTDQPLFGAEDSGNPAYDDLSDNFDLLPTKKKSFKTSARKTSIKCVTLPGGAASLKSLPMKSNRKLEQSSKGNDSETGKVKKQDFFDDLATQDYGIDESISNNEPNVPINEAFVPETQPYDDIDGQTQVYALEDQPTILYENPSNIKTPRSKRPVEQSSFEDDDNATQAYGLLNEGASSIEESHDDRQGDTDDADQCATQAYGLLDQQTIPYSLEADNDETDELATQAYGIMTKASLDEDVDDNTGDFCATQAYGLSDETKPGLDVKRMETATGVIGEDEIETQAYGILGNTELDEKFLRKSGSEETAADDFETQAYDVSDAANVSDQKYLEKSDGEETDEDLDQATQAYGLCSNNLPKKGTNDDLLPPRKSLSGRTAKARRTVMWSQGGPMENEGDLAENNDKEKQENAGEDKELKVKAKKAGRPKLRAAVNDSCQDKGSMKKGRPCRGTKSMTLEVDANEDTSFGRRSTIRKVQLKDDEGVKGKAEEIMTVKKNQRAKRTISEKISQEDEAISTWNHQPNIDNIELNQNGDFVDKEVPVDYGDTEEYSKLKRNKRVSKARTARGRGSSQRGRRKTVDDEISDDEESGNLSERKKIGVVTDSSAKKENLVEEEEEADTVDEETDSLGANEQSVEKKDKKSHLEAQQSKSRRGRKQGTSRKSNMEREHEIKNDGLEMTFAKDDATALGTGVSVTEPEIDENKCLEVLKSISRRGKKRGISGQPVKEKGKEDDRNKFDGPGTSSDESNSTANVIDVSTMASAIEESKLHEERVSISRRGRKRRTLSQNVKERENEDDEIRDNGLEDINVKNDSCFDDIDVSVMASEKVENESHKAQGSISRRGRKRRPLSTNAHDHGGNGAANDESNKTDLNQDSSTADNVISLGATDRDGNRRRGTRKSVSGRGRKRGTSRKSVIEQESIMMEDRGIETTSNGQNIAAEDIDVSLVAAEGAARRHDVITKKPRENEDDSLLGHSASSVDTSLSGDLPGKNRRRTNIKGKGRAMKCNVNEEEDNDQDAKEEEDAKEKVPRIMFTGLTDKNIEKSALALGAQLADSVYEATHLVTDKVRRTVKFLCCLSRGIPIVGPQWLAVCKQNNSFGEADEYTVKDKSTEKQYDFNLQRSLQLAKERKLLDEYSVYVTKNVKPDPKQMKDIIQCCGGQALHRLPKHVDDKTLIISCEEDKSEVKNAAKSGYLIHTAEILLTGILRQKLEPDLFKLDVESESEKRGNKRNHSRSELETSKNTPKRRKR